MSTLHRVIPGVAAALLAGTASAGSISPTIFNIDVASSLGAGTFAADLTDAIPFPDFYLWQLPSSVPVMDTNTNTLLGSLIDAQVIIDSQPGGGISEGVRIGLSYTFQAADADTDIVVSSGMAIFAPIANAVGYASAGMPLTDNSQNGEAIATGTLVGNAAYGAMFNGGMTFAGLLSSPLSVANPGGSNNADEEFGNALSPIALGQPVSSISAEFSLSITAGDSVGGTSIFAVVPTPATGALLAMSGLTAMRRRR